MEEYALRNHSVMPGKKSLRTKESKVSKQNHIVEEVSETGVVQYNCTVCGKRFRSRTQKYYHLQCKQLNEETFECDICRKTFTRQSQLKYHKESHASPVNECTQCHKIFSNPLALKKHESLHKVEPKTCPYCDKTFLKKISLEQHIAAQHLHQLQYECTYCSKKYASKSTLQLHLQSHEKKQFKCSICGKFFQRNSILRSHVQRHNRQTSIYKCHICDKTFGDTGALSRHRKIHEENILQYYCVLCDKNISRKDNMTRHIKTIHPEETFNNIVKILKISTPELIEENELRNSVDSEIRLDINDSPENMIPTINIVENAASTSVVIIENKLIQKPIEFIINKAEQWSSAKSLDNDNSYNTFGELQFQNKVHVITSLPMSNKIINDNFEKTSIPDPTKCEYLKVNELEQNKDVMTQSQLQQNDTQVATNLQRRENLPACPTRNIETDNVESIYHYVCNTQSVIRSVGNVSKKLDLQIQSPQAASKDTDKNYEYKHKKYNHHYNVELYRKILGCGDDDNNDTFTEEPRDLNPSNQEHDTNTSASTNIPTMQHWRKSFKNIYETSSSF
ncbi:uncharacterized protein LOC142221081 [Haematobia irritans]|uniref:uncharacterized protein LOC142221081 n=1 Tax=Haematobia irritans TaxID=7368 RepID=UPI003F509EB5